MEFLSELASKSFPPISNTKLCNKLSGFCWPPFTFERERERHIRKKGDEAFLSDSGKDGKTYAPEG